MNTYTHIQIHSIQHIMNSGLSYFGAGGVGAYGIGAHDASASNAGAHDVGAPGVGAHVDGAHNFSAHDKTPISHSALLCNIHKSCYCPM